jgi:hypothetical protein
MTIYKFGDIVLIGFPHTDLQGISKRPAIVLYDSGDQDVLLARIITQEECRLQNTELRTKMRGNANRFADWALRSAD